MSKYKYTETEQQLNNVLVYQSNELNSLLTASNEVKKSLDESISGSEELLKGLGYGLSSKNKLTRTEKNKIVTVLPTWENLCLEAEKVVGLDCKLESLFTKEELIQNEIQIKELNNEFNQLHKLDTIDITISAFAGIIGGAVDILLVGIPAKTKEGLKAGTLSNYIREQFEKKYPVDEMDKIANKKISKVSYDAQDNRNTTQRVEGLSTYYHRLLALGHDPILGFIVGVFDILTGRMTTIDKNGKLVSQVMDCYKARKESDIFSAIAKQVLHLKTDINTSMGLPVPFMALFNFLQFGSIGDEEQTIAEIVQGMYYEGYDFVHFCSMSIPVMIVEVIIRLSYCVKRLSEGHKLKDSIPFSLNRDKHPKLGTMLFIGQSGATAINAGKIYFTGNPMAINYPQWLAFAKYSYQELKWTVIDKPKKRDRYVLGEIQKDLNEVYSDIDTLWKNAENNYIIVIE